MQTTEQKGATYHIRVDGLPFTVNSRVSWETRSRSNRRFRDAVAQQAKAILAERNGRPIGHARLGYTLIRPYDGHEFDFDNAISMTKPLTDGLVYAGLIADDDRRNVSYDLPVRQDPGPERAVEMVIAEVL
jgi:hypothetical protein